MKIFLGEVRCIFIIAADEQLIGEGLRMRYKELLQISSDDESTRLLVARKGKEYFEKIIQLGIRVPEPGSGNVHRFLAAQFPQWLPATDLIQAAVGTNPRRLKQYCTWLTYKYMVARDSQDAEDDSPLLNKLIELRWWSSEVVEKLRVLAGEPGFKPVMKRLEQCLRDSAPDQPRPTAGAEVDHTPALEIYDIAVMSTPLQRLFITEPLLSDFDPGEVAALASVAGIVPEPETATMLRSGDRVLMRILDKVTRTAVPAQEKLLADDLTKLFTLEPEAPGLPTQLQTLAGDREWQELAFAVESALEAPAGSSAGAVPSKALPLLQLATANENLRRKLLEPQRLSTIPPEMFLPWAELCHTIPTHDGAVPPNPLPPAARATLLLTQLPLENAREILTGLQLRIRAARRFIARRKFVKLDALAYSWPAIAELLQKDLPGLRAFESNVVDPDQKPQDLPEGWKTYHDEKLNAFLRLRPLLRDIYADELGKYLKVSNAVVVSPQEQVFEAVRPEAVPLTAAAAVPPPAYIDVNVRITADPVADTYAIQIGDGAQEKVTLDSMRVERFRQELSQILHGRIPSELQTLGSSTRSPELSGRLRDLGQELYDWFFGGATEAQGAMLRFLRSGNRHRFRLDLPAGLTWLPWELLYAPAPFKVFLGLTNRYSLVRLVPTPVPLALKPFSAPLRILAMFASPDVTGAELKLEEEEKLLLRVLEPALRRGRVTLEVLRGRDATHIALQQKLRELRPHVFHFAGHGEMRPETEGALGLVSETGGMQWVSASDIANYLRDQRVALAVLSGCDTGRTGTSDSTTSVAGALNHAGVPMVIGTTRGILDDAGLVFARDFYRALIDGYTVEASLIEARKAQSVEKWDWSAFALFTTGSYLDDLRLEEEPAARTGTGA